MGLLFLIAGYFVPDSFDRKGPAKFLRDRMVQLGISTLSICFSSIRLSTISHHGIFRRAMHQFVFIATGESQAL